MRFLVKLFPEITIKSRPVRRQLVRQLRRNIRAVLREIAPGVQVHGEWDALEVLWEEDGLHDLLLARLQCIPGIDSILEVEHHPLPDMDGILDLALARFCPALKGKTFAVRCKRGGQHAFRSVDVERHIGEGLLRRSGATAVCLDAPEVTVALEIRQDDLYLVGTRHPGLGGYPLGSQDSVLSLVSGGYDSAVSSYLCMRRGLRTHFCFFNLGGRRHELAVQEVALYLWLKYHASHRVRFISVPFEAVVREILDKVERRFMGVVLKRMMLRAADRIAQQLHIPALVTGESVAQVSSQTLMNLARIDGVCETLVLRPLATSHKQQIIDMARDIGTESFSRQIPEYCAVISDRPSTRAKEHRLAAEEAHFDFHVLEQAIANTRQRLITQLESEASTDAAALPPVPVLHEPPPGSQVIDIRHPTEVELKPLRGLTADVQTIPFYTLQNHAEHLDPAKQYLLYCERGMLSRLHAALMWDEGHHNLAVLDFRATPLKAPSHSA